MVPVQAVSYVEANVQDYYFPSTGLLKSLDAELDDIPHTDSIEECGTQPDSYLSSTYPFQQPVLHVQATSDMGIDTYNVYTTDIFGTKETPVLTGIGDFSKLSVKEITDAILEKDLRWMNTALCYSDEKNAIRLERLSPATAVDRSFPFTHSSMLEQVQSITIDTPEMLEEFVQTSQYFTHLESLSISPQYQEQFRTEKTTDVKVPATVKHLEMYNTTARSLAFEGQQLETLRLHHNLQLSSIDLTGQSHLKEILLGDVGMDYEELRSSFPDAQFYLNVMDAGQDLQAICDDPKAELFENLGGSIIFYTDEQMWREIDKATDEWIAKNITSDMTTEEKCAAVYKHFQDDVKYSKDYKYVETNSMASAVLDRDGVCESKSKAMVYTLEKMGIDADVVYCNFNGYGVMPKTDVPVRIMNELNVINHAIVRVNDEKGSIYFDPTMHRAFLSREDLSHAFEETHNTTYTFPGTELKYPSSPSLPESETNALLKSTHLSKVKPDYKLGDNYLYCENVGHMAVLYQPSRRSMAEMTKEIAKTVLKNAPQLVAEKFGSNRIADTFNAIVQHRSMTKNDDAVRSTYVDSMFTDMFG